MTEPNYSYTSGAGAAAASTSIAKPSGVVAGQKALVIYNVRGTSAPASVTAGWTRIHSSTTTTGIGVFLADDADTATWPLVITHTSAVRAWGIYILDNATAFESNISSRAAGTATITPPSITPSWGDTEDTLFILTALNGWGTDVNPTGTPTNYADRTAHGQGTGSIGVGQTKVTRKAKVASETPATWSGASTSAAYRTLILAVKGFTPSVVQKIAIGSTLLDGVDDIRIGNDTVSKIYVGDTLVYG